MDGNVLWYETGRERKLRFRWWFFAGTVVAAVLVFVDYLSNYTPLRASGDWMEMIGREPFFSAMAEPQLLGVGFLWAWPLLLWRGRVLFIGEPSRGELVAGYGVAILGVVPVGSILSLIWKKWLVDFAQSWRLEDFPGFVAGFAATAILLVGAWVAWRLGRRRMNGLAVQAGMVSAYAANLLLCTVIFHPFQRGFFTPIASVGYFLGLPVLVVMLGELLVLGLFAGRRGRPMGARPG